MRVAAIADISGSGPYKVVSMYDADGEKVACVNDCNCGIVLLPSGEQVKVYKNELRTAIIASAKKDIQ